MYNAMRLYASCTFKYVTPIKIDCLFRKQLNKGPLLYVHLNLSLALLLALVVFLAGLKSAVGIPVSIPVLGVNFQPQCSYVVTVSHRIFQPI